MEMTTDCFSALSHGSSTLQKNDVYKDNISMDYPCGLCGPLGSRMRPKFGKSSVWLILKHLKKHFGPLHKDTIPDFSSCRFVSIHLQLSVATISEMGNGKAHS